MDALEDHKAGVVEAEDAGDAVGAVVDCGAEGCGEGGHMFGREGSEGRAKGVEVGLEGVGDGGPFCNGVGEGVVEGFESGRRRGCVHCVVFGLIETAGDADRTRVGHHAVHWGCWLSGSCRGRCCLGWSRWRFAAFS